eukprot:930018-Pleurochrysis_carterae.AAC.3
MQLIKVARRVQLSISVTKAIGRAYFIRGAPGLREKLEIVYCGGAIPHNFVESGCLLSLLDGLCRVSVICLRSCKDGRQRQPAVLRLDLRDGVEHHLARRGGEEGDWVGAPLPRRVQHDATAANRHRGVPAQIGAGAREMAKFAAWPWWWQRC